LMKSRTAEQPTKSHAREFEACVGSAREVGFGVDRGLSGFLDEFASGGFL